MSILKSKKKNNGEVYYNLNKLDKEAPNARIKIIAGEKGNGKSYAVKERVLNRWRDNNEKFVYLRRFDSDCTASKIERVFSDLKDMEKMTGGYNFIGAYTGVIYMHKLTSTMTQLKRASGMRAGYYGSIQKIIKSYSSIPFPEVNTIVLDEVSQIDGSYLENESFLFDVCLSTILRRNKDATIYIVGNTWDRDCPYYKKYGIDVTTLEQGTVTTFDHYNQDGTHFQVAIERCLDLECNNNPLIVTGRDSIIKGQWYTESQNVLRDISKYSCAYKFYVQGDVRVYECKYIVDKMDSAIYVSEYDFDTPPENERVISKNVSMDCLYTPKLVALTPEEGQIFTILKTGKVFYSDDLTGTEFRRIIKYFM